MRLVREMVYLILELEIVSLGLYEPTSGIFIHGNDTRYPQSEAMDGEKSAGMPDSSIPSANSLMISTGSHAIISAQASEARPRSSWSLLWRAGGLYFASLENLV